MLQKNGILVLKISNFGNYPQNVSNFDENLPKIGILSRGITNSNPGIVIWMLALSQDLKILILKSNLRIFRKSNEF
jgi:hypothetical protein